VCDPRVDLDWLQHRGTPVVTVDQTPTKGVPAVNVDDAGGARAGAEHLLGLGHRRIGVITVGQDLDGRIRPAGQRWAGWHKALAAAGVEPVVAHAGPRPDTAAYFAAKELLDRPDCPTALLCFSDVYAAHAIRAAEDLGLRVPEDLSVVGYDDADFASTFRPALTTIRQDVGAKGRAAVTALTALIDGRAPKARTVLRTELVVRDSTAVAPPSG
jgi:DNA-binding LacI/PurR family transcriptional regulator